LTRSPPAIRARGKALTGELGGFWRYRVGDWRLIVRIEDARLMIVLIEVGHRREVYR
jgi:mRNA interferase RelE/StbE